MTGYFFQCRSYILKTGWNYSCIRRISFANHPSFYILRICLKFYPNSVDPDQTPPTAASDLRLYCLCFLSVGRVGWSGADGAGLTSSAGASY